MERFKLTQDEENTLRVLQRAEESAVASGKLPSGKSEEYKKLTDPQRVRAIVESYRRQMGVSEKDFPIVEGPLTKSETGRLAQGKLNPTEFGDAPKKGDIFTSGAISYPESVETSLHELLHAKEFIEGGYKNKPQESHFLRSRSGESETDTLLKYMDELRKEVEIKKALQEGAFP